MIQSNELRRNNLIYYGTMVYPVDRIMEQSISVRVNSGALRTARPHEFEPVKLSPEILEACGFDNREGYLWFLNDDFYIHFRDGSLMYNGMPDGSPVLHFLHELQNLTYALTGTELFINLEQIKV